MKKLFVYILTYLLLFAPIVHAWEGIAFSSRAGVDPTGLVVALRPLHSTLQDQRDRSRQDNDFEQKTGANQYAFLSSMNASAKVWDYDGSDFNQQVEIADETGVTEIYLISKDGETAVEAVGFHVPNPDETYGATIIDDGVIETGAGNPVIPTGWINAGQDAGESSVMDAVDFAIGTASYDMNVNGPGEGIESDKGPVVAGNVYIAQVWLKRISGSLAVSITDGGGLAISTEILSSGYSDWTLYKVRFTSIVSGGNCQFSIRASGAAARWKIDDASIKQITNPTGLAYYATPSGTTPLKYRIVLNDGTPDTAWAYIGEEDGEEASTNTYTSDFSGGVDGWAAIRGAVVGNIDFGGEENNLQYTTDAIAGEHNTRKLTTLTGGIFSRVRLSYYIPAGQSNIDGIRIHDGVAFVSEILNTTNAWTDIDISFTSTGVNLNIFSMDGASVNFTDAGGDDVFYLRAIVIDEYIALGTTAVHLYDDPQASNRILTGDTGIDLNAIIGLKVLKTIGTTNLTKKLTVLMWVKPDDGQPADEETLISKYGGAGTRSIRVWIQTDGTLKVAALEDGSSAGTCTTNAAVFTNGAQLSFKQVGFVYSTENIDIYVNGVEVASTQSNPTNYTTLYDTYLFLLLGGNNSDSPAKFLNGQIAAILKYERALTAAEYQRLYLQGLEEGLMSLN